MSLILRLQLGLMSVVSVSLVLSRCDRLGDLVLSLPCLGMLRDAGFNSLTLHCSPYALAIAEWAQHNGLCDNIWVAGTQAPPSVDKNSLALSLFHSRECVLDFRKMGFRKTYGPRSKLSALWSYKQSLAQHRSRVVMSEMEYNIALVEWMLKKEEQRVPPFRGLPALKVPVKWKTKKASPHTVVVVSNSASADNWSIENYIAYARSIFNSTGKSLDFLVSGHDAHHRKQALLSSGVCEEGMGLVENLASVQALISYLSKASFVMSSSTGPLHIAHAAGVDVFGVYPSKQVQSFDRWRPYGYWHKGYVRYQVIQS